MITSHQCGLIIVFQLLATASSLLSTFSPKTCWGRNYFSISILFNKGNICTTIEFEVCFFNPCISNTFYWKFPCLYNIYYAESNSQELRILSTVQTLFDFRDIFQKHQAHLNSRVSVLLQMMLPFFLPTRLQVAFRRGYFFITQPA